MERLAEITRLINEQSDIELLLKSFDWATLSQAEFLELLQKAESWLEDEKGYRLLNTLFRGAWKKNTHYAVQALGLLISCPSLALEDKRQGLELMQEGLAALAKEAKTSALKQALPKLEADYLYLSGEVCDEAGDIDGALEAFGKAEKAYQALRLTTPAAKTRLQIDALAEIKKRGEALLPLSQIEDRRAALSKECADLAEQVLVHQTILDGLENKNKALTAESVLLTRQTEKLQQKMIIQIEEGKNLIQLIQAKEGRLKDLELEFEEAQGKLLDQAIEKRKLTKRKTELKGQIEGSEARLQDLLAQDSSLVTKLDQAQADLALKSSQVEEKERECAALQERIEYLKAMAARLKKSGLAGTRQGKPIQ
jgi:chromosome segregation ATPase